LYGVQPVLLAQMYGDGSVVLSEPRESLLPA